MDLNSYCNPFDFANPVAETMLLVGRESEMDQIKYYLNHAKNAPRPINIALLGQRASGKTSIINITENEAKNRGFCTVRINLDEDDAKSQLAFFFKLFDSTLSAACEMGAFGGITGKTYDTYLNAISSYTLPDEMLFCPFIFPIQYAKAMSGGNINAPISDHSFMKDLTKLAEELKHPIILLFDEGNVLTHNRVLLQKLRNIFMNIPSYMLVISGTPDFFPIMDEVFSPIVRQFKKINVGEFKAIDDTLNCINKPLERLGVDPKKFVLEKDAEEIHNLSGGRPYEIQLICHVLFRRVQSKRAPIMKINFSVLEEVRLELETSQNIASRPILTKVRNLTKEELTALNVLCRCNGNATFDQIWGMEYIFRGEAYWSKDILEKYFHKFVNEGLLTIDNKLISFAGDDFDKIYIKYWAGEQDISLQFSPNSLESQWEKQLTSLIRRKTRINYTVFLNQEHIHSFFKSGSVVGFLRDFASSDKDFFVDYAPMTETIYMLMIQNRERETLPIIAINPHLPWLNGELYYVNMKPDYLNILDEVVDTISSLSNRVAEIGGKLFFEKKNLPIVPSTILIDRVEHTKNEAARQSLARFHLHQMYEAYRNTEQDKASFEADLCYRYDPEPGIESSNSLGYVFLFTDDLERAEYLFNRAISLCSNSDEISDPIYPALPKYNLGIVYIERKQFEIALTHFQSCISLVRDLGTKQKELGWLWIPALENGTINLVEHNSPDLLDAAEKAKEAIEQLLVNVNNGEKI